MPTREVVHRDVIVGGRSAGILERGAGDEAVVLLHGGLPGVSPYVGCSELWRPLIDALDPALRVVAIDLPGTGRSELAPGPDGVRDLLVDGIADRVRSILRELHVSRATLVTHGQAGAVGFLLAREQPAEVDVAGHVAIAPVGVAPTGDAAANLALLHPPQPLWTHESQRWALSRLTQRDAAVTPELVDTLVDRAQGEPFRQTLELAQDPGFPGRIASDQLAARAIFNAYCRETGYEVPISLIWGAADPLLSLNVGNALFAILSTTRAHLEFNVVNRVGHFPALEDAASVVRVLEPFLERCAG